MWLVLFEDSSGRRFEIHATDSSPTVSHFAVKSNTEAAGMIERMLGQPLIMSLLPNFARLVHALSVVEMIPQVVVSRHCRENAFRYLEDL